MRQAWSSSASLKRAHACPPSEASSFKRAPPYFMWQERRCPAGHAFSMRLPPTMNQRLRRRMHSSRVKGDPRVPPMPKAKCFWHGRLGVAASSCPCRQHVMYKPMTAPLCVDSRIDALPCRSISRSPARGPPLLCTTGAGAAAGGGGGTSTGPAPGAGGGGT